MTTADRIVEQMIGNLEEKGTGIFVKHLRNGPIFTCKCPACGTLHGGFKSQAEAESHLKCRRCYRTEIEKLKKETEKVDEPKPQKNIFQNPLNPRKVIESESDDLKDVSLPSDDYEFYDGDTWRRVSPEGVLSSESGENQGQIVSMKEHPLDRDTFAWPTILRMIQNETRITGFFVIFKNGNYTRHQRPATLWKRTSPVAEALEDDPEADDMKDVSLPLGDEIKYMIFVDGRYHPVLSNGMIGNLHAVSPEDFSGQWRIIGVYANKRNPRYTKWPEVKNELDAGKQVRGYIIDYDHGSYRRWGNEAVIFLKSVSESVNDDDLKSIMGSEEDMPLRTDTAITPGEVTKFVCMSAHYNQEFYSRLERTRTGFPLRVRVSGKCKTWRSRPNEFRLPVKFGLNQSLYITHDNAGEYSSIPLDANGSPL